MKKILCIIIPFIAALIYYNKLDNDYDKRIENYKQTKQLTYLKGILGDDSKDKGYTFSNISIENGDLMIQGSSELGAHVDQLPTKMFPSKDFNYQVTTLGRAGVEDLDQSAILTSEDNPGKNKLVYIVSLQWFLDKDGVDKTVFQSTFSPVQFYKYLDNEKISDENKHKYAKRVYELLDGCSQYSSEQLYASIYDSDNFMNKMFRIVMKPYYFCREKIVTLKEKALLAADLSGLPDKKDSKVSDIDWGKEEEKAEKQGMEKVTNNDFYIADKYYTKDYEPNLENQKNCYKDTDLLASKEFEDYKFFLDTCSELNVKPYIVLMPTNGRWYDYTGLDSEKRVEFYDYAEKLAKEKGFDVLNLKDKEYTPYYMVDGKHLGWKGWLDVDKKIYEHFSK